MSELVLCAKCFSNTGEDGVCPACGFDNSREKVRRKGMNALPLMYPLEDRYLLGRVLGAGGFGITYLALDLAASKTVAVKEFFPTAVSRRLEDGNVQPTVDKSMFAKSVSNFYEEARILYELSKSPYVVDVDAILKANNTAYLVMEYIEGDSLNERAKKQGGRMSQEELKNMVVQAALALGEVHSLGIIHCDISPSNILIKPNGDMKLIDFGASKNMMLKPDPTKTVALKPSFAPPEQYKGGSGVIGPWSDLYALACTYYRLSTGSMIPTVAARMEGAAIKPLREFDPSISEKTEATIARCLDMDYRKRYSNVDEFLFDFIEYHEAETRDEPVEPPEITTIKIGTMDKIKSLLQKHSVKIPSATMTVLKGLNEGCSYQIKPGRQFFIGRQDELCSAVVSNSTVISRVHCVASYNAATNSISLSDKSSNGVSLEDGRLLNGSTVVLRQDSIVYLSGGEVVLLFSLAQK